jgi:two-component system chemotaxis response regulator CheB
VPSIRVLVVDDSAAIRMIVAAALAEDPTLTVVGAAANGRQALSMYLETKPDVVLLDVEMPVMNGLQTLAALRGIGAKVPIIMFSSVTEKGAATTLQALFLGASDYATKPRHRVSHHELRALLVPKIKALYRDGRAPRSSLVSAPERTIARSPASGSAERVDVVAMGASTGGPPALAAILPGLKGLPVPILVAQHMPPLFTKLLAESLATKCGYAVRQAAGGETLEPGTVWIAPGDYHMEVVRVAGRPVIRVHQGERERAFRPAVDLLVSSVAETYGKNALAVILTGIGQDGLGGCRDVKRTGGRVLAQDERTSVVWGMPKVVIQAELADMVLPLESIAAEVARSVRVGR